MNPLKNKPLVFLKFEGFGCRYNIRLNDIPVISVERTTGTTTFETPVTFYLTAKENTIALELIGDVKEGKQVSFEDKPCYLKTTVLVGADNGDKRYPVLHLNYIQDKEYLTADGTNLKGSTGADKLAFNGNGFGKSSTSQITVGKPQIQQGKVYHGVNIELAKTKKIVKRELQEGIKVNNTFSIPLPFDSLAFLKDAETIPNTEQTKQELLEVYESIWHALENNDVASLKSLFAIRTKYMSQAMYAPEKEISTLQALQEEIVNSSQKLHIPTESEKSKEIFLNVFAHGKMANLTYWAFDSILWFDRLNTSGSSSYNLIFSKINGEWKVVE